MCGEGEAECGLGGERERSSFRRLGVGKGWLFLGWYC